MGEIKTVVDPSHDLTINTATGKLTIDNMIRAAQAYLSTTPTSKVLWDLRNADGSEIVSDDFDKLHRVLHDTSIASTRRKIAVVVARKFGFGLSRVFQTYAEISGIKAEYHIVYSMDEAMAWLNEESITHTPPP
jgi:predicted secreted protein